jgi:hypothetical protein
VLILKGKYKGQKLMMLVNNSTAPTISKVIPTIPVTMCVKYNTATTTANNALTTLSVLPKFFFINFIFSHCKIAKNEPPEQ